MTGILVAVLVGATLVTILVWLACNSIMVRVMNLVRKDQETFDALMEVLTFRDNPSPRQRRVAELIIVVLGPISLVVTALVASIIFAVAVKELAVDWTEKRYYRPAEKDEDSNTE